MEPFRKFLILPKVPGKPVNLFLASMVHSNSLKTVVILAGGLGSRYNGLKQTDALLATGETLLEFSIFDAIQAGFNKFVLIVNQHIAKEYIARLVQIGATENVEMHFVRQEINGFLPDEYSDLAKERRKPWGTAHAVLTAKAVVSEPFVVINADDFYGRASYMKIKESIAFDTIKKDHYEMIAFPVSATLSKNGTVSRGICTLDNQQHLIGVVEHTRIKKQDAEIVSEIGTGNIVLKENILVSMNFWCFHPSVFDFLQHELLQFLQKGSAADSEFFIPAVVQHLVSSNRIKVKVHESESQWMGLTYPEDKSELTTFLSDEIKRGNYPNGLW
ncbi:sugar phosphate nucleotidyltransferase [Flavobacterium pedocola]